MNGHASLWLLIGSLVASLMAPGLAVAERGDRDKPINIEADSVKVDDIKKTALYEGHVVLSQGTLSIQADRIDIRENEKGQITALAEGKPAHFRQKMDQSPEYAEGWAEQIDYDGRGETLKLNGQARLKRGIDEVRGNQIVYEASTDIFQAVGGANGKPGRVRAVIRPKTSAATPQTPGASAP